jgi:putative transposase
MAKTNYHIPLQPGGIYHILSRANGDEKIFYNDENRRYFLYKFQQHIFPVAETFAWVLLPTHFHFIIRVRPEKDISAYYCTIKKVEVCPGYKQPDFIMERFANWLNAYTKAFNKMYDRKGSLFIDYLRRVAIINDRQLAATLFYIHSNAAQHGLCVGLQNWHWSSYQEYYQRDYKIVSPEFVQDFFGTWGAFYKFHQQPVLLKDAAVLE